MRWVIPMIAVGVITSIGATMNTDLMAGKSFFQQIGFVVMILGLVGMGLIWGLNSSYNITESKEDD